ncbi:MAG: PASTA domain-containing protein, partial [Flavobacteriales bacterium]|nr:PASTA domain-containing protein [Flavobacteriales bacterium]
ENSFFSFLKNKFFHNFIAASIVTFFLFWSLLPSLDWYTNGGEELELKDFQGLFIEDVSNELEQLGLKYQIIDSVFTDSVPKGAIFIQDPIAGTFVKEGRTLYFTVRRISSEKIRIPEEVFDGKDKTYMKNNLGSNFKLVFIPENGSDDLVVKYLRSGERSLIGGNMLIKGSTINVYLELDEDIDKDNRIFIDNLQSTD